MSFNQTLSAVRVSNIVVLFLHKTAKMSPFSPLRIFIRNLTEDLCKREILLALTKLLRLDTQQGAEESSESSCILTVGKIQLKIKTLILEWIHCYLHMNKVFILPLQTRKIQFSPLLFITGNDVYYKFLLYSICLCCVVRYTLFFFFLFLSNERKRPGMMQRS